MDDRTLSFGELWLLYLGIHRDNDPNPIGCIHDGKLTRESGYNENLNMPANGLSPRSRAQILTKMQDAGLIEIFRRESPDDEDSRRLPFNTCDLEQFEAVIQQETEGWFQIQCGDRPYPCHVFYELTPEGIAAWESYARPDWGRFRGEWRGHFHQEGIKETIWSQSAQHEAFAREVLTVNAMDPFSRAVIHWDSEFVAAQEPWEPMPGKTLPSGVTVYVRVIELGMFSGGCTAEEYAEVKPFSDECYRRFGEICRWYDVYLGKHPDCPPRRRDIRI